MAGGWAKDDAVTEQIDATVNDALDRVRRNIPQGESLTHCEECDAEIPEARRKAVPGVRLCVNCQAELDEEEKGGSLINRRGSKDSQLR
ncbi:MAG: DksA/TraR family C4-type zinc finger protein [Gammaproteobacteria bacterium]|nr:DksA/TraR family C4-type zinc finger protein [Gammaproteobacteria bacterium]